MKIVVGSTALKYFSLNRREPSDLDLWLSEGEVVEKSDSQVLPMNILELVPTVNGYATPDAIYTIKCSHAVYDVHWEKTKSDILWLKSNGCVIIPELYEKLKVWWLKEHGNKDFLSLNKTKDQFFDDNVVKLYSHDWLHELVAYPNVPVYTRCLKDGHEVLIDKAKFDLLSFEDQVRMFREEITVIAAERWVINPYWKGEISWYRAHMLSVRKTATALTKNWAAEFIVLNLEHFVKPDYSYWKHMVETLKLRR